MSPAATRQKPELEASSIPAVAEAITRRHDADVAEKNKLLAAYRVAVTKAAKNETIRSTDADAAVVAAHALGLQGDRLDRDVQAMRQALTHEAGMAAYAAATPECVARSAKIKAELAELKQRVNALAAEGYRLGVRHHEWLAHKRNLDDIKNGNPHLFADAATIGEEAWRRIRA